MKLFPPLRLFLSGMIVFDQLADRLRLADLGRVELPRKLIRQLIRRKPCIGESLEKIDLVRLLRKYPVGPAVLQREYREISQ